MVLKSLIQTICDTARILGFTQQKECDDIGLAQLWADDIKKFLEQYLEQIQSRKEASYWLFMGHTKEVNPLVGPVAEVVLLDEHPLDWMIALQESGQYEWIRPGQIFPVPEEVYFRHKERFKLRKPALSLLEDPPKAGG